jgi:hypothetical protein
MKSQSLCIPYLLLGVMMSRAMASSIDLQEYAFSIDGVVSNPPGRGDPIPSAVGLAAFNTTAGLGSVVGSIHGAGPHSVAFFVDHEIDQSINTFFNEVGSTRGAPPAGLSWEIDEPGFSFGDIYDHFTAGALDNAVGTTKPDDVSMALSWDFTLAPGESATIQFVLGLTPPTSGFYLEQQDPDSVVSVFFSGSLRIGPTGVPENGPTWAFLLTAATGLLQLRGRTGARS